MTASEPIRSIPSPEVKGPRIIKIKGEIPTDDARLVNLGEAVTAAEAILGDDLTQMIDEAEVGGPQQTTKWQNAGRGGRKMPGDLVDRGFRQKHRRKGPR
ncbi:MAG TPA: hypothetical protein VLF90_03890 [Patescibacteria group bacterium]|nr:hypothetical protein [Patescibacteria group bacterium]